jgi:hypothetical protein
MCQLGVPALFARHLLVSLFAFARQLVRPQYFLVNSSIDMYNNDVGQESAQKFMK